MFDEKIKETTHSSYLNSFLGRLFYKIVGWEFTPLPDYFQAKQVVIGFPHTSNLDTLLAFAGFKIVRVSGHVMIKKEWFKFPLSIFLRGLGGIPVNRKSKEGVVPQMVEIFKNQDKFNLAIVPEATRKGAKNIKILLKRRRCPSLVGIWMEKAKKRVGWDR